jgi:phosphoribosylformylglycinamidine cyclo-ligase
MDYKSSGVDIDAGNRAVDLIKSKVKSTYNPLVLNALGGFAAFMELPKGYEEPVLVSCTDGVGTKVKLAIESGILNTVGIDLVAMCVNDLICSGAKPLFFLDYIACHKLVPEEMDALLEGMVEGCKQAGCALIGGEMAEMNDMYRPKDFDLAGFSVGVVEKSKIINGQAISPGDYVYGLPASGPHSNGYSLLRKVLTPEVCRKHGLTYDDLLTPTPIYVSAIKTLLEEGSITGIANITGGGIQENLARIMPKTCKAVLQRNAIPTLKIFDIIQKEGHIPEAEMFRVFNNGIGMIVVSKKALSPSPSLISLGSIEPGTGDVLIV